MALLGTAAALAGCATMSEQDCRQANWRNVGLADGRAGTSPGYIQSHAESCAKAGVQPNAAEWRLGYADGVRSYCTPNSAWTNGTANRSYQGACAGLDEGTFLRYHRAGMLVYQARQDLTRNRSNINRLEDELKKASKDEDRRRLRDEIDRAERERNRLTALMVTLELASPPR